MSRGVAFPELSPVLRSPAWKSLGGQLTFVETRATKKTEPTKGYLPSSVPRLLWSCARASKRRLFCASGIVESCVGQYPGRKCFFVVGVAACMHQPRSRRRSSKRRQTTPVTARHCDLIAEKHFPLPVSSCGTRGPRDCARLVLYLTPADLAFPSET